MTARALCMRDYTNALVHAYSISVCYGCQCMMLLVAYVGTGTPHTRQEQQALPA